MGWAAGIVESLVQSHEGRIHILPAIPASWRKGKVYGLHTRGGYRIDLEWNDGILLSATISSNKPGKCSLRYRDKDVEIDISPKTLVKIDRDMIIQKIYPANESYPPHIPI
jgi:alpha-L-fucosidase 2